MFGLSWCAAFVKNNFTGDCHPSDDVESIEIPVNLPAKIEDVGISFEVKPASSTDSGSRASARLEGCLESLSDFERAESEAISLMTSEQSQQSFLVDVEELLHKKPLCSTSHCQISTVQWRGQTVAMKEVNINPADAERLLHSTRDLLQEIHIMRQIKHPCLVKLLGANLDTKKPFLLTEFLEHQDVESYMRQRRAVSVDGVTYQPRFGLAMRWAISTGRALAYLHGLKHPIIHRDVKPLNLFLNQDLEVKLGDFGLCKVMAWRHSTSPSPAPKMTGLVGTWRYMAPEVVRRSQYNEKVDIYSFSLILYLIFSGRQPWYAWGNDGEAILKAYVEGKEPRPSLDAVESRELRDFLPKIWHRDADQRPSAEQCVERLSLMKPPGLRDTMRLCTPWTKRFSWRQ